MFQNVFQKEISKSKIVSLYKLLSGNKSFFDKNDPNSEKVSESKMMFESVFRTESIQNVTNHILEENLDIENCFPLLIFFWNLVIFGQKGHNIEK